MFSAQFKNSLEIDEEDPDGVSTTPNTALLDTDAHQQRQQLVTDASREVQDLEDLFSLARNGKYEEIEGKLSSVDWTLPIDAKDSKGNTLLSIACQNDNKRIVKLCLRKGADVNTQNINGQTPLHFCYAYKCMALFDYLIEKGADDTLVNADDLTCYEGLSKEEVEAL